MHSQFVPFVNLVRCAKCVYVCLCFSPGDRITVLDDSNEEWWRVSSSCWNSVRKKSDVKCSFFHTFISNGMTGSDLNRSLLTTKDYNIYQGHMQS